MKKFAKGCLAAALSMLGIGTIILVICVCVSGTTLYSYAKNTLPLSDMINGHITILHNDSTPINFSGSHPTYSGQYEDMQAAFASDIQNLDLDMAGGNCMISESSDEYFHIYAESTDEFQYYTEHETLYIKGFEDITFHTLSDADNYIRLEVPKDFRFDNIELELGAGMIKADSLLASNHINMEIGAGELTAKSLSADTLSVDIGAGNVELENASIKNSDLEIGLGNMTCSGLITGNLTAECGMGNLSLYLNDDYENHNYKVDLAMGSMTLNQKDFHGFIYTDYIQHGVSSTYTLECGMGNMSILFK